MTEAKPLAARQDRARPVTREQIAATALRLLVEHGPDAVSLRGVARDLGMTAPGLYRYYGSREELLRHVIAQLLQGLADDIRLAISEADAHYSSGQPAGAGPASGAMPELAQRARVTEKLTTGCQEFRQWARRHKDEFMLLFGAPLPQAGDAGSDVVKDSVLEFARTFYSMFVELWDVLPIPVPDQAELRPGYGAQFAWFRDQLPRGAPDGMIVVFLRCWALLYGAVSIEICGHVAIAFDDPDQMFELILADLARMVGLEYPIPASR
ncbi:MAG TPA: TetR/AcrR family transcriptional regulator [Trebonia sp.]|nr:TetR/AcrR family transcriptional regulator [Trebonia sp.]